MHANAVQTAGGNHSEAGLGIKPENSMPLGLSTEEWKGLLEMLNNHKASEKMTGKHARP